VIPPLNVLVAFPYINRSMAEALLSYEHLRLIIDSGAFTAWASGKPIDLDTYCRFLETTPLKPWRYFVLDVIGDAHASRQNYETMLARGLNPIPVFTPGETLEALDEYWQTSDVVAVGGLNAPGIDKHAHVRAVMRHAAGRKVHLLGYAGADRLKALRPYMCDASSWEGGARYGAVNLYMGGGRFESLKKADFASRPSPAICRRLREFGVEPTRLANLAGWSGGYSWSRRLSARSAASLSLDLEKHTGTKLFLALNTPVAMKIVVEAHRFLTGQPENPA